jgi:hypothetical protein
MTLNSAALAWRLCAAAEDAAYYAAWTATEAAWAAEVDLENEEWVESADAADCATEAAGRAKQSAKFAARAEFFADAVEELK